MKYSAFENILSSARLRRYLNACGGNTKQAMTLYRLNLRLSQELLTIICCFEVALRNNINNHFLNTGANWLRDAANNERIFDNRNCRLTANNINMAIDKLNHNYSHNKLVAELGFGFWRYMFAANQYKATGQTLLRIFPAKPISTPGLQYNHTYVFNQLAEINELRNRIAHHEPICFKFGTSTKDTVYSRRQYALILQLFQWMTIDVSALLYGLDHVITICNQIDSL